MVIKYVHVHVRVNNILQGYILWISSLLLIIIVFLF